MIIALEAAAVVLDIEGTTTPIAFVHDILFSFARTHLAGFLARRGRDADIAAIGRALAAEHAADTDPERPRDFAVEAYVRWLMERNSKSTALKALQGEIWRGGYESGALRSEVYADVPPAFAAWSAADVTIAIYSSGSIDAQRLLFAHTTRGDLTRLIDKYFDTTTGPKRAAASYAAIARALDADPDRVVFVSDVGDELLAAREAGVLGVLSLRPGNAPVPDAAAAYFPSIRTFADLSLRRLAPLAR